MIVNGKELNNQKRRNPRKSRAKQYIWAVLEHGLRERRASATARGLRALAKALATGGQRLGYPRSNRTCHGCGRRNPAPLKLVDYDADMEATYSASEICLVCYNVLVAAA